MFKGGMPAPAWLCFGSRIAKKQGFEGLPLKGKKWPEITGVPKARCSGDGEQYKQKSCEKAPHAEETCGDNQENPVDPDSVAELNAG